MQEYKEKEETRDINRLMPDEEKYGFPTEATPVPTPSQLEIEAIKGDPHPLQLEKGVNGDDGTRILYENGETAKPVYEELERDMDFAKALEALDKVSEKKSRRLSNDEPSGEYKEDRIYTWWKQDSSNEEWEIIGSRPRELWVRLDFEDMADIDAEKIIYGGKEFHKFAFFEYDYNGESGFRGRCKRDDRIRVNKYSLTPNAEKEVVEGVLGEEEMRILEREKKEKRKRKEESNQLTIRTPTPRFPQKQ